MQKKIAERWAKLIVTAITHAVDNNKLHISIAGNFNTQYEILEWPALLSNCLSIFEKQELYEHCAEVIELNKKVEQRVRDFNAQLTADTIRG